MCVCAWFIEFLDWTLARTLAYFVCSGCPAEAKVQECQLIMEGGSSSQLIITMPANRLWTLVIVISTGERNGNGEATLLRPGNRRWRVHLENSQLTIWGAVRFISGQYANCQRQRGEKSWGNLRIGVKSEVVYSRRSSVHGKCIETVAIRAEESVLKKINRRNSNSNYACILHKGRRWKCQKKIYRTRSHKIIGFVNWRII